MMRGGKRIKVNRNRNRYYNWHNRRYEALPGFIKDEADRKEYPKVLATLKDVQLQCAAILIKHGCSPSDLTADVDEDTPPLSPVFLAVQSHSYELATKLLTMTKQIGGRTGSG